VCAPGCRDGHRDGADARRCRCRSDTVPSGAVRGSVRTFLTSSRARLRRARPSGAGQVRTRERETTGGSVSWREKPCLSRGGIGGHRADSGAGGMPRPDGREPSGRGAATRSARPHPQAGSSRRNTPTVTAPARTGRAVLLAPGILSPSKDRRQGRAQGRVARDGATRHPGL
jgi:hypothetical protein